MKDEERTPVSPYLKRRLRSIAEAEEDMLRLRDRTAELARSEELRPSAQIIPFRPQQ